MKRSFYLTMGIILSIAIAIGMVSCKKEKVNVDNSTQTQNPEPQGDGIIRNAVKDYDGNTYDAVRLGEQIWMASNLRTTHYSDGTPIDEGTTTNYHHAYRYQPSENIVSFGYLYNWPAVMNRNNSSDSIPSGVQGICPEGWHVPSDAEWDKLVDYCMSKDEYACVTDNFFNPVHITNALASNQDWESSNVSCSPGYDLSTNNSTGFGAYPAGIYAGGFSTLGKYAYFWAASGCDGCTYAYTHYISSGGTNMYRLGYEKNIGLSVRCVKD